MRASRIPDLVEALGAEVAERRLELGFTQQDLASFSGLDRPYISLLEKGRKQPTLSVLFRLAVGLGLTLEELAGRVERRCNLQ
jgi:transcriptional regulator with XRE-family HTH domain